MAGDERTAGASERDAPAVVVPGVVSPGVAGPGVVNSVTGPVHGNVVQFRDLVVTGGPVRSHYARQVRRIAPAELVGRDAELRELADSCVGGPAYRWWRAPAWSGKSALASWFALHPPPGVRVVSFFVTARLAGQDDRAAFVDNVLEQLIDLLGREPPPLLTATNREAHLLGLLAEAARACLHRGEHLVLLVDGLDEDRGVTTGRDAHSIAALLPHSLPAGLKVVVTGRPDPPLPDDVPDDHPLRDPAVVRPLSPSPRAQARRVDMERDLRGLLHGTPVEQDLLGLLTAAGGGLAARDLAELTGESPWSVADHLKTVTARSFSRRGSRHRPGEDPDVYVLGHEELHVTAVEMLGRRLEGYRDRLHAWADAHRDRGWPEDTPEYLLAGYHAVLAATGDVPRLVACGTDPARHDRLLERSGGDTAALAEIGAAQRALLAEPLPDLVALARLAVHRDRLTGRNTDLPHDLPALWAALGHADRARALAGALPAPARAAALELVVVAALGLGDHDLASAVAAGIDEPDHRVRAEARVRESLFEVGDLARARASTEEAARTAGTGLARMHVAASWVALGELDRAERVIGRITDTRLRGRCTLVVVRALVAAGDLERALSTGQAIAYPLARDTAVQAVLAASIRRGDLATGRDLAERIADPTLRAGALARLVHAAPDRPEGRELLSRAVATLDPPRHAGWRHERMDAALARLWVVDAALALGDLPGAERLAEGIEEVRHRARAIHSLVRAAHAVRDRERAARLLDEAEALVDFSDDDFVRQGQALAWLLRAARLAGLADHVDRLLFAAQWSVRWSDDPGAASAAITAVAIATGTLGVLPIGDGSESTRSRDVVTAHAARVALREGAVDRAHDLADSVIEAKTRYRTRAALARDSLARGEREQAGALVRRAEEVARTNTGAPVLDGLRAAVVDVLATTDLPAATALTSKISTPPHRVRATRRLIDALVRDGDHDRARPLLADAIDRASLLTGHSRRDDALLALVDAAAGTDHVDLLWSAVELISRPLPRYRAFSRLVAQTGRGSRPDLLHGGGEWALLWAVRVLSDRGEADRAEEVAASLREPETRVEAYRLLVAAAVAAGDLDRARRLSLAAEEWWLRGHGVGEVVRAALAGDRVRADALIAECARDGWRATDPWPVVDALLAAGLADEAEALVRSVVDADQRRRLTIRLATSAVRAGDLPRAEALAAEVADDPRREHLLPLIGSLASVPRGAALRVLRALRHDDFPDRPPWIAAAIALGDLAEAERLIGGRWSAAAHELCVAAAGAGDADLAGRVVDRFTPRRAADLRRLLPGLPPGPARRLRARALVAPGWDDLVGAVCRDAPEVLDALLGELHTIGANPD
ncbi:hypothetical protein [Saccharothrix australiensis]|uniref:NACHT domain-containing protein n=1 Tax=Saccharothrix australiensis TaxID=2072 RepID=A0A495VT37_9PSEU|nr:hypothetical protein [Saccharothrix australiensis]RKT52502.1 hypothetical protein C8E97_1018 [Saccharothrix australiensis]